MTATDSIFSDINNTLLDLQASQLQGYDRHLKRLATLLDDPALSSINQTLTEGLDLAAFLDDASKSGGGMVGSAKLPWPDDQRAFLGLTWLLIQHLGANPGRAPTFAHNYFHSSSRQLIAGVHEMVRQLLLPFARDYRSYVATAGRTPTRPVIAPSRRVFIVHGRDDGPREAVARFLERQNLEPIILHEQASRSRTVIEKIEAHRDVGFAVVLLTPDDEGRLKGDPVLEPRARQNVLLELGYFMAFLGRDRICALTKGDVNIPSDFAGVVWQSMDDGAWRTSLARELEAAGYTIDWHRVSN